MDKINFKKVSIRLKQSREASNITLEEAGQKVGVHKSTILRWENGETEKIKIPILEVLANYYNVNPMWLMGYDVPMQKDFKTNNSDLSKLIIDKYGEHAVELLKDYSKLNDKGKERVNQFAKDLQKVGEYTCPESDTNIKEA